MGAEAFVAAQIVDFAEATDDRVASLLVAGSGISLAYNDGAGTLTIVSTVSPTWGSIGGTLSNQTDLQTALNAKMGGSTGSTDNRILRADGTGGATVQNSAVTIDDSGNISGLGTVNSEGQLTVRRGGGTAGTQEVQIYHDSNGGWVAERSSTRLNLVSGGSIIFGVNPGAPTNTGYGSISGSAFRVTSSIAIGWLSGSDPIGGSVDTALRRSAAGVVEINNGTAGQTRDLSCRAITASGIITTTNTRVDVFDSNSGLWVSGGVLLRFGGQGVFVHNGSGAMVRSSDFIGWSTTTLSSASTDTALRRASAGVVEINNGTAGQTRDLVCRAITASGLVTVGTYTVATLPSAAANAGALAQVTDSSVTTNGIAVSSGGANRVVVFSNGSNWDVVVA